MAQKRKKDKAEEKAYEVKDKRRVNPDGSLKEEVESRKSKVESPEMGPAEQAAAPEAPSTAEPEHPEPVERRTPDTEPEHPEPVEGRSGEAEEFGAGEEIPPPDVYQTLQFVAGLLAEQAWQFMGLHLPPGRKEIVRDMAQAKICIDTVIYISDKLHPHLDEEGRRALRGLLSDLQLNFVRHGQ